MAKKTIVTLRLPMRYVKKADILTQEGFFLSRSEFFREAIRKLLDVYPQCPKCKTEVDKIAEQSHYG